MNAKLLIIAVVFLIGTTNQQCATGCLRCNSQNQCLLCDITNNFRLVSNSCQLTQQVNCLILAQNGNCVLCSNNYYLDANSQSCLQVQSAKVVANCNYYNGVQACASCNPNYYISNGACVAVTTTVANCRMYNSNGWCSVCAPGYIISGTVNSCLQLPTNNNCLYYTFLSCPACASGYIANQNLYFTNWSNNNFISSNYLNQFIIPNNYWNSLQVCQLITVQNCLVASAFNVCSQCISGYYLQNGACFIFPQEVVQYCATYSALRVCIGCSQGYFLSSATLCSPVVPIANCTSYSGSASTTTCTACSSTFFLTNNACSLRTNQAITNCQALSVTADNCATCNTGFVATTDNLACLPSVPNCQSYVASTLTTTAMSCSLCVNLYYVQTVNTLGVCTLGSVPNCLTYTASANTCSVCANGYYLSGTTCVLHLTIANCATYSTSTANVCSVCNTGYYAFTYASTCVAASATLANCVSYTNDTACATCATGYYKTTTNTCLVLPAGFSNCINYDATGNTCVQCSPGLMLSLGTNKNCTAPLDYVTASCAIYKWANDIAAFTSTLANRLTCKVCNDYNTNLGLLGAESICVNANQLYLYNGFTFTPNCKRFGYNMVKTDDIVGIAHNAVDIVCMECASGFFLVGYETRAYLSRAIPGQTPQLTCSSTCAISGSTLSAAVIPDTYYGFVNVCVPGNVAAGTLGFFHPGICRRYNRWTISNLVATAASFSSTTTDSLDYNCFWAAPNTDSSAPIHIVGIDTALAGVQLGDGTGSSYVYKFGAYYPNLITAAGKKFEDRADFGGAYSNTVDSNTTYPSVFNYNGLLPYVKEINMGGFTWPTNIKKYADNLLNCDLFYLYNKAELRLGAAFSTAITNVDSVATVTPASVGGDPATNSVLTCLRCTFGYMLSYVPGKTLATNFPMPSCVSMATACAAPGVVYGGLPTHLNTFLSCHLCANPSSSAYMYPSIWIEVDAAGTTGQHLGIKNGAFVGWQINGIYTGMSTANQNSGFKCAAAPLTVKTGGATTGSITNCAVFGYLTPLTTLETAAGTGLNAAALTALKTTAVCLACQANSFPQYGYGTTPPAAGAILEADNIPKYYVTSCTPSAFCDMTVTSNFNGCGRCLADDYSGTVPVWYAFQDWTLSNCIKLTAPSPNCLVALDTGSACNICKGGYFLNGDNICDAIIIPNAPTTATFGRALVVSLIKPTGTFGAAPESQLWIKWASLQTASSIMPYGVSACNSGYIQFPAHQYENYVCGFSKVAYNRTADWGDGSAEYVNHCVQYGAMNANGAPNKCAKCANGYIAYNDFSGCVASADVAAYVNCTYASAANAGQCHTCNSGSLFVTGGTCQLPAIKNCVEYDNTNTTGPAGFSQTCKTCMSGFARFTSATLCTLGQVQWCAKYTDDSLIACTECAPNYTLVKNSAGTGYYCYPIPTSLNCLTWNNDATVGVSTAKLTCTTCNANATHSYWTTAFTPSTTQLTSTCLQFNLINNCNSYNQNNAVINSNDFMCAQCGNNFWFSTSNITCVPRSNQPAQCQTYTYNADTCATCTPGSYLSADAKNCIAFPTGIAFCNQYTGPATCSKCNSGYYLSNNACFLSTVVTNCQDYSANYTCVNCISTYFLTNSTTCTLATASACLTYTNVSACATCAFGWGLLTTNNITSCVNALATLSNCVNATTVSPFRCLTCAIGYFPDAVNATCIQVPLPIPNCLIYDTAVTCTLCNQTTILNIDRTACNSTFYVNQADPNCGNQTIIPAPACTQCAFGYYFQNGSCVACSANTLSSGCLSCDPTNNASCLVCAPTYYMNAQGQCIATNFVIPVSNTTTNPLSGSSTVTKALAVSLSLFAVYFDRA